MFARIAIFEMRYQWRSPVFWIGALLFFLMAFGATTSEDIQIGARGNVHVNAPFIILQTLGILGVFGIFVSTAFVAGSVIRDDETGFAPLLRSTQVKKADYVFGRFTGATVVAFSVMVAAAAGLLIGSWMPWLDPSRLGATRVLDYLYALFAFVLPTLLVMSAAFFALATATRSLMWTYIGAVALLVLFVTTRTLLRDPAFDVAGALTDPFGVSALRVVTKYWTATERNTLLPPLTGLLLANRLIWLAVSGVLLGVAYRVFRMDGRALWQRRPKAPAAAEAAVIARPRAHALPAARPRQAMGAQFWAMARLEAVTVFRSPAFFVLMAIGIFNAWGSLWFANRLYGTEVYPVTRLMVQALQGAFTFISVIVAVFYAGELVWRDRQQRMHDIVDATVAPDGIHLLPKILAIVGVLTCAGVLAIATAMVAQTLKGYTQFEISHYLLWYLLPQTVTASLLAVLAVFVQTLVPHKMIGWAVMLAYMVVSEVAGALGFEHNLYLYAGTPPVPLSDMNGQGHFWQAAAWFQAYWVAFAAVLVVLAHALRRRGAETSLRQRLARLPQRLRGAPGLWLAAGLLSWAGLGGWIFYNTTIVNRYETRPEREAWLARYEKALLPFESLPQPTITDVTLKVAMYPHERRAVTEGSYRIENRTQAPLQQVHVGWVRHLKMTRLEVAGAVLDKRFDEFDYRIYRFEPALQPGESRLLSFATELRDPGFRNHGALQRMVDNGSFIDSFEVAPMLGLNRDQLLKDRSKRRKQGLTPELRMAKLEDEQARRHHYLRNDSDWVQAQITLETDADQTPVAPGVTVSDTTQGGRRTLVTRTESPIQFFFSMQSARYAVKRQTHHGVELAVYHQPGHAYNVQRMLDAMATSLDVYSQAFSPYQFKQARILEFPAYASFAQAFAGTIPYSEGIGFVMKRPAEDETDKIDMVTYITAHEMGHQWWAHQVIGADQQGSTMLSETFAQYAALLVMERLYGREQIRKFLKYELDSYLRARGGELIEELPLSRVENQPYIHYRKGSLAMYWLKDVEGEAVVNRALQRLLQEFAFKPAPYPNTRDFLRLLREEAGPAHEALIADLFERITLLDTKATKAVARQRPDGRWELKLDIEAHKRVADGKGEETEAPMDEEIDIGVFDAEPGKPGFKADSVLLFERRRVKSGAQTLTLVLDRQPRWAGVDPYNKRIDRNSDDNLRQVDDPE
jgi:ABC-2 type transport system permease protein